MVLPLRGSKQVYDYGAYNLWWNLFGSYVTLRPAAGGESVILPGDGAAVETIIYTSHEDCTIEAPEWLACEIKCEEGKTAAKLVMTADPMDDGASHGRDRL